MNEDDTDGAARFALLVVHAAWHAARWASCKCIRRYPGRDLMRVTRGVRTKSENMPWRHAFSGKSNQIPTWRRCAPISVVYADSCYVYSLVAAHWSALNHGYSHISPGYHFTRCALLSSTFVCAALFFSCVLEACACSSDLSLARRRRPDDHTSLHGRWLGAAKEKDRCSFCMCRCHGKCMLQCASGVHVKLYPPLVEHCRWYCMRAWPVRG